MLTKFAKIATALVACSCAGSAFGFFDVQVLAGRRWYDVKGPTDTTPIASQEIDVAAHLDPIPLVPVAFGASVALGTLRKEDFYPSQPTEAKTFEAGLDIMAWVPMVPVVTPYARLKYPLVGTMVSKFKDSSGETAITEKISGPHLDAGIKYSPLPIVKILAEVGMGMQKHKEDEIKVAGKKLDTDTKSYDLKSNTFLVGVEIGL